jgi:hypothetical protein
MTIRKEQEFILQDANLERLKRGAIDRREFLTRTVAAGLGLAGVATLARSTMGTAYGPPADPDLLSVDRGSSPRHPDRERPVPA